MSLTMAHSRTDGGISKDKILRRMQNLLNKAYLSAQPVNGGGYRIPEKVFEAIQTELDFSPPDEKSKVKVEEEVKKRYRQRDTYRFWKESLETANIPNAEDARDFLMSIYNKLDNSRMYGSLTHSCYALETLNLAVDDTYGTSSLVLSQYKFHTPKKKKKKAKKSKAQTLSNPISSAQAPF